MGSEKIRDIAICAILIDSYKCNKDIFQSGYTVQNGSISRMEESYIHG